MPSDATFLPTNRMLERAHRARADSDTSYFFELMYLGELSLKVIVLELLAAISDDRDRNRYALEFRLVRANSLGDWADVLDEGIQGPASQHLSEVGRESQRALNETFLRDSSASQRLAVDELQAACAAIDPEVPDLPSRVSLRTWVRQFVWLRNRTRGHGSPLPMTLSEACLPLERSIEALLTATPAFGRPWAHVKRSLSGKYRVSAFGGDREQFAELARESGTSIPDGVYVFAAGFQPVPLMFTDPELTDFLLPNGNFKDGRFECLSYLSDDRRSTDGGAWVLPVDALPVSETAAAPQLDLIGQTFSNLPPRREGYVARTTLEAELEGLLRNDRHPVVTLQGRGGVGKTSLALEVLNRLAMGGEFFAIIWFSARDIDLLPDSPRVVRADVLSREDVARDFASLMRPSANLSRGGALSYFTDCLAGVAEDGPFLFVFDNFETLREQAELYATVSNAVRLPNKVLITTRTRDFKADYPIEVSGMERSEYTLLVAETSARLGITAIIDANYEETLYEQSDGHPYVTKVLLGEIAHAGKRVDLYRVIASRDRMLSALFERSFASLSPSAQRVFLTLCSWRSLVPRIGLEAAVLRPGNEQIDVERAVAELLQASLVEELSEGDAGDAFLSVPMAAATFGKQKLVTSPLKTAIDADLELVRGFGAIKSAEAARGLAPRVERLTREIAKRVSEPDYLASGLSVLEYIANSYAPAWLNLAELQQELGKRADAVESMKRYLEANPDDGAVWGRLVGLYRSSGDTDAEMHARLQHAELTRPTFEDLMQSASRLNYLISRREITSDADVRRLMVAKLKGLIEERHEEADATDLSRLAWLCMHLQDVSAAQKWVDRGLALEPENPYCRSLYDKVYSKSAPR